MGAMAMGADAIKAVEIASEYIESCGRGCDYVTLKRKIDILSEKGDNGNKS